MDQTTTEACAHGAEHSLTIEEYVRLSDLPWFKDFVAFHVCQWRPGFLELVAKVMEMKLTEIRKAIPEQAKAEQESEAMTERGRRAARKFMQAIAGKAPSEPDPS